MAINVSDLAGIFTDLETSLSQYNNDTTTVTADQAKIADLQAKLASDITTQQADGGSAYSKVAAAISALQSIQSGLPVPPPVVPVPVPTPEPTPVPTPELVPTPEVPPTPTV